LACVQRTQFPATFEAGNGRCCFHLSVLYAICEGCSCELSELSAACTITISMPPTYRCSSALGSSLSECIAFGAVRLDGLQSSECCAGMPLCSSAQPGASQCSIRRCCGLAERLAHAFCALVCMDRANNAVRDNVRGRHVGRCRMSFVWVPSMSVGLVGPYASMPDMCGCRIACFVFAI
jgi:hypothetical protein